MPLLLLREGHKTKPAPEKGNPMNSNQGMKSAIEKVLEQLGELEAFQSNQDFAIKILNEPFMPLSIEKHDKLVTISHYFEQNGDLIPDPDMEFLDLGRGDWIPVAIQHSTGHYARAGECEEGVWKFNAKALRDLQSFANLWGRNLIAQGFGNGQVQYAKSG